ncbi:MAG: T9SS type A sorting domain-containing protein [bacterium]|nr:MAG: T9SS type A sorting domain-containing protein [bacterium]
MRKLLILFLLSSIITLSGFSQTIDKATIANVFETHQKLIEKKKEHFNQLRAQLPEQPAQYDNYDANYYRLDLQIKPAEQIVSGTVTVKVTALVNETNQVVLDLFDNMAVSTISGQAKSFTQANDQLTVQLDKNYNNGDQAEVSITYSGTPTTRTSFEAFRFIRRGNSYHVCTDNQPYYARTWFPCKDTPGDKPDSVDMIITVPQDLFVVTNGVLQEIVDNGDGTKTYYWHEKYPIATYLISLAIATYAYFSDEYVTTSGDTMPLDYYVFPEHLNSAQKDFEVTLEAMNYFVPYFGEYPFLDEKYGMAEYLGMYGGMENQTITSLVSYAITGDQSFQFLIAHELSHQWWGDMVTPAHFDHIWINEGFATYSEALYAAEKYGEDIYHLYMSYVMSSALTQPGALFRYGSNNILEGIVYDKGGSVIHMLRRVMGDSAFFAVFPKYGAAFAYGNATTENFQQFCENEYGASLEWFFHQWVYEPGHPKYKYGWTSTDLGSSNYQVNGYVDQTQTVVPLFKMPLDITLVTAAAETTTQTIFVDEQGELFEFFSTSQPQQVILDKDNWILKEIEQFNLPQIFYLSHSIDDSDGNGNGHWDEGETIELLVELNNLGVNADNVSVTLQTRNLDISIQNTAINFGTIPHRSAVINNTEPYILTLAENARGEIATLTLNITGENNYNTSDSLFIEVGQPHILFIDDDNDANYEEIVIPLLKESLIYAAPWDNYVSAVSIDTMKKYDTVIWITGDDRETTLTPDEQALLADYLNSGGKLLLSGQNIGYDLIENGSFEDSLFYADYLKAEYMQDNAAPVLLIGIAGDPITHGLLLNFTGSYSGAGNQDSPDVISPIAPAALILKYSPSLKSAGLRYINESNSSFVIYLPFGIEGIAGPYEYSAKRFLNNCLSWLSGTTEVHTPDEILHIPTDFNLEQNYPNPFNPSTTIEFHVPIKTEVSIEIYNILGQKIRTLVQTVKPAGFYQIQWDGSNDIGQLTAGGLYFYRMKAGKYSAVKKMVLLR